LNCGGFGFSIVALRLLDSNPVPANSYTLFHYMFAEWRSAGTIMITAILLATMIAGCGELWSPNYGLRSPSRTSASRPPRSQAIPNDAETIPNERIVKASYYGRGFSGHKTASGERFNPNSMTAASKTLPIGSVVHVTNLETGRSVNVRINDRGPYVPGRSLDLSHGAARRIGLTGVARVKITPVPARWDTETATRSDSATTVRSDNATTVRSDDAAIPSLNATARTSSDNATATASRTDFDE
jgi:rare lipoprotein A